MAHVFLSGGRSLRCRLFPKPKSPPRRPPRPANTSLALFDPPGDDDLFDTPSERLAVKVATLCLFNRNVAAIVERMPSLGIRDWWLAAECLFQSVWNLRSGRPPDAGIDCYDLFYFSEDLSWEAENDVIHLAAALFADLSVTVQLRNQARAHLWYPEKFGAAYPPLTTAAEGILRLPCTAQAVGLKRSGKEFIDIYAPYGLGDVWDIAARPNRVLPLAAVYADHIERWRGKWPQLVVYAWDDQPRARSKSGHKASGLKAVRSTPEGL